MSCGKEFVETLKKIGYPKADILNGEDFDWLFDDVDFESFLKWFCGNVNEQNVLSEKELEDFSVLQRSGKPILEGTALDEVLRTCKTFDLKTPTLDDKEIQKLEDEVQILQKLNNLKIQRWNNYQLMASETSYKSLTLNAKQEEATKKMKQSQRFLNAVITKLSNELHVLIEGVNNLIIFFRHSNLGQGTNPVFLSQFSLEKYIRQEEQSTGALTLYTKKQFFQGIHEVVESSNEENFQLLDIQTPSICDNEEILGERRLEMARLQTAYICAQQQIIYFKASNSSMKSSVKWAEENLHSLTIEAVGEENLDAKISSLNSEILKLEEEITHMKDKILSAVVKENAQLLNMPIVKGDFDLQIAKQDYYTGKQEFVLNQLIKQKASFELVQLSYEIELRRHWDTYWQLENLVQQLSQGNVMLCQRLETLADPSAPEQLNSRTPINTKDYSTHRLYQLLEGDSKKKELFITHEHLEEVAEKLKQDVSLIHNQLAVSTQEQFFFLSKLNNDVDMLCDALYHGGNQLLLCDQELMEHFHQVESKLNKLNHLLTDILADVKTKRKILATNKLHQVERELYDFLKMESYEACIGFDLCETPLSTVAQKIMCAMRSGDFMDSKNEGESTKTSKVTKKSSVHYSVLADQERTRSLETKNPKSLITQTPRGSIGFFPQPSITELTSQLSVGQVHNSISSSALSSYLIPQCDQDAPVSQKMEHTRKENIAKENEEILNLKRKFITCSNSPEKASKHIALEEDTDGAETWLNSENTRLFGKQLCDVRYLDDLAKVQLMDVVKQAEAMVVTLMYEDGSTQLRTNQEHAVLDT